ncbi:hypothetical protein [Flaviaesturariibacter amylovorans]|uniref:DUF4134 domain-containing protein n=1 Tax=Flaviaesturariibacter amylovorans TaxID=1084520 RepID=A0ABP8HJU2_9BACT
MRTSLFVLFLLAASSCFAQYDPANDPERGTYDWHRRRGTSQVVAGSVLTAGGVALVLIGQNRVLQSADVQGSTIKAKGGGFIAGGILAALVGIPVFISGISNAHKAKVLLRTQAALLPGGPQAFPALGLRVALGKR